MRLVGMIKIDDRFECDREKWCWHLVESLPSKSKKTGEDAVGIIDTYHPSLESMCMYILDRKVGDSELACEIVKNVRNARDEMVTFIKLLPDNVRRYRPEDTEDDGSHD